VRNRSWPAKQQESAQLGRCKCSLGALLAPVSHTVNRSRVLFFSTTCLSLKSTPIVGATSSKASSMNRSRRQLFPTPAQHEGQLESVGAPASRADLSLQPAGV